MSQSTFGIQNYSENTVDADSNADSTTNTWVDGSTSYPNAQTVDSDYQIITEVNTSTNNNTHYELSWEHQIRSTDTDKEYYGLTVLGSGSGNISIIPSQVPIFTSTPANYTYAEGTSGNELQWIATDLDPNSYSVYKDGGLDDSGVWSSGVPIIVDVDGLTVGEYNYTIVLVDNDSDSITDQTYVIVVPEPVLKSIPMDLTYVFGNTGNQLSWTPSDSNANKYKIFQDGLLVANGS